MPTTRSLLALASPLLLSVLVSGTGCATAVRTIAADKIDASKEAAQRYREEDYLAYSRCTEIAAPAAATFALLADVDNWSQWNSTILKSTGQAKVGETVTLVAKIAPDREFNLNVTHVDTPKKMVWEDGMPMGMFSGVRTYTLAELPSGGTDFCMVEVLSGTMLGMIEPELPDMRPAFEAFAVDLKKAAEAASPLPSTASLDAATADAPSAPTETADVNVEPATDATNTSDEEAAPATDAQTDANRVDAAAASEG